MLIRNWKEQFLNTPDGLDRYYLQKFLTPDSSYDINPRSETGRDEKLNDAISIRSAEE